MTPASQSLDPGCAVPRAGGASPGGGFFEDDELGSLQSRALSYLSAGIAVHFQGPAGMGKTTLALRVAERMGRPVSFIAGDTWLTRADLVGREIGHSMRRVEDSYIASVRRVESQTRAEWQDAVLATAMADGHVLVYDEFTRASPETNAMLLSVLEEGVLVNPDPAASRRILKAHRDFRIVLTSNPEEYVGVNAAPDALMDRIVTFRLDSVTAATECGIVRAQTGLADEEAARLVRLVRTLRAEGLPGLPISLRTTLLIARIIRAQSVPADPEDPRFLQICADVLAGRVGAEHGSDMIRRIVATGTSLSCSDRTDP
jgi:gas vesicle protein GvpN